MASEIIWSLSFDEWSLFVVAALPVITIAIEFLPQIAANLPGLLQKSKSGGAAVSFAAEGGPNRSSCQQSESSFGRRASIGSNGRFMARQMSRNYMAKSMKNVNSPPDAVLVQAGGMSLKA